MAPSRCLHQVKIAYPNLCLDKTYLLNLGCPLHFVPPFYRSIVSPAFTHASTAWYSPLDTPYACIYIFKDNMLLQNNCFRAISGAHWATHLCNLEVQIGVPPLVIYLDSIKARFDVWLEEYDAAWVIREAVEKVDRPIGGAEGQAGGRKRRRAERRSKRLQEVECC